VTIDRLHPELPPRSAKTPVFPLRILNSESVTVDRDPSPRKRRERDQRRKGARFNLLNRAPLSFSAQMMTLLRNTGFASNSAQPATQVRAN